jgi:uncharacterized protein with PQ loop repeat
MWSAALPAVLWGLSISICLGIVAICIVRSHYGRTFELSHSAVPVQLPVRVRPVTWPVITWHLVSLVLSLLAYGVYMVDSAGYPAGAMKFYASTGWICAALLVILIAINLVLMYFQARRAARSQIEEILDGLAKRR